MFPKTFFSQYLFLQGSSAELKVFQSSFILISRSPFRTEPKPKQTRRCRTNKHFDVAETGAENKQDTFQQNVDDHQPSHNHTDRVKLVESLLELGVLKLHHRGHDDRQLLGQLRATTGGAPPLLATTGNYWQLLEVPRPPFLRDRTLDRSCRRE